MNEYTIVWLSGLAGLGLVASSTLYSLGGRSNKWLRRWVGAFVLAVTIWATNYFMGRFNPWMLLVFPWIVSGYHLGYGASKLGEKVYRRSIYAATIMSCGILMAILTGGKGAWTTMVVQFGIGAWSIYLGVINPVQAAAEEFYVSMVLGLGLVMYAFV